MNQTESAE